MILRIVTAFLAIMFKIGSCEKAQQIVQPNLVVQTQNLDQTNIVINDGQLKTIPFFYNQQVYSISLFQRDNTRLTLNNYTEVEVGYQNNLTLISKYEGCYARQRRVEYANTIKLNFTLAELGNSFVMDFAQYPRFPIKKILLITNQYRVSEITYNINQKGEIIEVSQTPGYLNLEDSLNFPADIIIKKGSVYMFDHRNMAFVFTEYGAVKFDARSSISSSPPITVLSFQRRQRLLEGSKRQNLVFLAWGIQGVDIYQIDPDENGDAAVGQDINLLFNINSKFILNALNQTDVLESVEMIDVKGHDTEKYLFILDQKYGIHVIDIANPSAPVHVFYIQISSGFSFELRGNIVLLIIKKQLRDFYMQVFVDLKNKKYFINNWFDDGLGLQKIIPSATYSLILSQIVHQMVFHSVYEDFTNKNYIPFTVFYDLSDIYYGEIMQVPRSPFKVMDSYKYSSYFIGISAQNLIISNLDLYPAAVYCRSNNAVNDMYQVYVNSSSCEALNQQNLLNNPRENTIGDNIFKSCISQQTLILNVNEVLLTSDNQKLAIGLGIGFTVLFLLCCLCAGLFYRKQNQEVNKLQQEAANLQNRQYMQMEEMAMEIPK